MKHKWQTQRRRGRAEYLYNIKYAITPEII